MDRADLINYWVETSDRDFLTMHNLYKSKDFNWSLFIGHLVIEKLLKALYVKQNCKNIPKIHDLLRLAENLNLDLNENQKDMLDTITTFNINARYPDFKQTFYAKCDRDFTKANICNIEELRQWLRTLILSE